MSTQLAKLDPHALIAKAIDKGVDVGTLERLIELAEQVRRITAREAYFRAMAEFKKRCPALKKTRTAKIDTARGSYSYAYAPLDQIEETVKPLLSDVGLTYRWQHPAPSRPGHVSATCIISHELGHEEPSGPVELPYADTGR